MTEILAVLIALNALVACGRGRGRARPEAMPASVDDTRLHAEAVERFARFLDDGQVVSRVGDAPEHVGDSLIWTGVAIGALPCDAAAPLVARLTERLEANGGLLVRYEPLPEDKVGGGEITMDGETGLYFGLGRYVTRCGVPDRLAAAWRLRQDAQAAAGGRLHPNVTSIMPDQFTFTRDAVSYALGIRGEPSVDRLYVLEQEIAAWMVATVRERAACYRLNLGYLHIAAVEAMGYRVSDVGRLTLCAATGSAGIATWDHWCGRGGLSEFVEAFEWNRFEFKHQRCAYEEPDGREGLETPALDLILALSILHAL